MATQIVRPAGAGYETAWVLAACVLVLVLAGAFIGVRTVGTSVEVIAVHEVDARRDLTAAEQGVYADLRIAADELAADKLHTGEWLSIEALADLGIAPFVQDMSHTRRGGHGWQRIERGSSVGYLGVSGDRSTAGALLLVMESHGQGLPASAGAHASHTSATTIEAREPDIWLHRGQHVSPPSQFDAETLARTGWLRIVAQFDAGVTRQRRAEQTP